MLTNLPLKMVIMITYLSHWDWILYNSRKDLIPYIKSYEIHAMCPDGDYIKELKSIYKSNTSWEIKRNKVIDIKAILMLRSYIKKVESNFHCFTLKTGILFSLADISIKNKNKAVLSITGLGFLFSNGIKAQILRILIKPFIKYLFNKSFNIIIFQNKSDEEIFLKFSSFSNNTKIIQSSGLEKSNFKIRENIQDKKMKKKVILISRLLYDKGIIDYLSLISKVNNDNFEFYLAGKRDQGNPQNITNKDMTKILKTRNLQYLGEIDVETELSKFDISIIMSSHEGFSRILLESLYVGLYCLAYRIQGTEVMKEFKNLQLIELNEIDKFANYIENFTDIDDNSHNRMLVDKLYTSKVVASQIENTYNELDSLD
jgi:glycosyltransferase involved in cell wall biosynthesis